MIVKRENGEIVPYVDFESSKSINNYWLSIDEFFELDGEKTKTLSLSVPLIALTTTPSVISLYF